MTVSEVPSILSLTASPASNFRLDCLTSPGHGWEYSPYALPPPCNITSDMQDMARFGASRIDWECEVDDSMLIAVYVYSVSTV